ncbi:MAG: hypothetical protein KDE32_15250 [Novosphingobium sp.]|nr:hypothetical protein [Novosphingobium sp.]
MSLLKLGVIGAAGYGLYRYFSGSKDTATPAFAIGEGAPGNSTQVRNAGAAAMRDQPRRWNSVDEASDASFPASDPPATY